MTQTNKDISFATIVPLIGGEPLGMSAALGGKHPEWVATYSPFQGNDSHYIQYLRQQGWGGDYTVIDEHDEPPVDKTPGVDVVCAVPPCAGLSSFSSKQDCSKNEWMIETADYILGNVKPRMMWGENAPRLASAAGAEVRGRIIETARKHGYSVTFYKTMAERHGVAQKRPRTFYFFWDTPTAPLLRDHVRENVGFAQQIAEPETDAAPADDPMRFEFVNPGKPSDDPYYQWALYCTGAKTHRELSEMNPVSMIDRAGRWNKQKEMWENYLDMAKWLEEQGWPDQRLIDRVHRMSEKLRTKGGGLWTHGLTMIAPDAVCPAFIGVQPHGLAHPTEDRFLNMREMMRMMSMPEDMQMIDAVKNFNHNCQNVCRSIAEDMAHDIVEWFNGNLEDSGTDLVIQDNGRPEKTQFLGEKVSGSLDGFM